MTVLLPEGVSLPLELQTKLQDCLSAAQKVVEAASAKCTTVIKGSLQFRYSISAPRDILTPLERAQSLSFIIRYEHLPTVETIALQPRNKRFYLASVQSLRHALTEYRPILRNERDSTYYRKVNATIRQKLWNQDETRDLRLVVEHETDGDVSRTFAQMLKERVKAIDEILKLSDFDYLYNGILQHSDPRYTKRFWEEYYDGRLNYAFIRHVALLDFIKDALRWHYDLLHALTFPKMGPL